MPNPFELVANSFDFHVRALDLISKNKPFIVSVKGAQAAAAGAAIGRYNEGLNISGAVPIVLGVAIIVGAVAVVGLGVLAAICIAGINAGYTVKAKHTVHGPMPFDDELVVELIPPQR